MRGRPKSELVLSNAERAQFTALTLRRKIAQALALRARIVLDCADGMENKAVAARQRVTPQTGSKWRARFVQLRLDGLLDAPRPGAPRSIHDARVDAVIARTLESIPEGATHWSTRLMARETDLSQTAVTRIWHAFGLQPHRQETFKLSSDPLFVEKVRDIVGLYLNLPLKAMEANLPSGLDVHLVMDNYGTHKAATIRDWLARHPRFHAHFTPTPASWLNQVERWFATLTTQYIRRGTHRASRQLEQTIKHYLNINNANPKLFHWAKPTDDILASIERFCLRTSNSGHKILLNASLSHTVS